MIFFCCMCCLDLERRRYVAKYFVRGWLTIDDLFARCVIKREIFESCFVATVCHGRILARDPLTTRSEDFSLLCHPAWGDPPFLRDLDALPYDNAPMFTPGLRRTRLLHPDYSDTLLHTPILTPHYPDRNVSVTSWRHPTRHSYICKSFSLL